MVNMVKFLINRLLLSLLIIWGILTITFLVIHLAPGDPSSIYVKPEIGAKAVENIRRQMGLDLPLWKQYLSWASEFIQGNFGISFTHKRPVSHIFAEAIPNTLQLTAVVFLIQFIVGISLGIIMAVMYKTKVDFILNSLCLFFYSLPGFWLALMGILLFSIKLSWLPSSQMESLQQIDGFWAQIVDRIQHLIMPVAVLAIPFIAYTARFVRGSLSDVLQQDYIRTVTAYGVNRYKILFKYALKNALLPLNTLIGVYLPFLLGGAVITEYIFSWPGLGRITVNAIFAHDYPIILASGFIAAVAVIVGNLISDLLYHIIDPRIKIAGHV